MFCPATYSYCCAGFVLNCNSVQDRKLATTSSSKNYVLSSKLEEKLAHPSDILISTALTLRLLKQISWGNAQIPHLVLLPPLQIEQDTAFALVQAQNRMTPP